MYIVNSCVQKIDINLKLNQEPVARPVDDARPVDVRTRVTLSDFNSFYVSLKIERTTAGCQNQSNIVIF